MKNGSSEKCQPEEYKEEFQLSKQYLILMTIRKVINNTFVYCSIT